MTKDKRLIDVAPFMKTGWHLVRTGKSNEHLASLSLADVPTVDAVEVVHGRCKWCNGEYHTKIMATAIRYHTSGNMDGYELKVNYCPNCGAKMDGDGNG